MSLSFKDFFAKDTGTKEQYDNWKNSSNGGGGGTGETDDLSLDGLGTSTDPVTKDAAGGINYTDNATDAIGNNVIITGFGEDDSITITGATAEQYDDGVIGVNDAGDVSITFNNEGILHQITLTGIAPAGDLIFDTASFNALAVGDLFFV